jgi:hypothetical protein
MKRLLLLLILVAALALPALAQFYQVGDTVDDFTLRNTENVPVSLYSYTNKIVMELFWTPG